MDSAHPYLLDFADNTHDLARPLFVHFFECIVEENLLPNGIFVREIAVCRCLANDYNPWCIRGVAFIKVAAFLEWDPHGAKVAGADFVETYERPLVRCGTPYDRKSPASRSQRRKHGDHAYGLDAVQRRNSFHQLLVIDGYFGRYSLHRVPWTLLQVLTSRGGEKHGHRQDVCRIEAWRRKQHAKQAVDHQPGPHQEHHRQAHFGNHQQIPRPSMFSGRRPAFSLAECVLQIRARSSESWSHPEQQRG